MIQSRMYRNLLILALSTQGLLTFSTNRVSAANIQEFTNESAFHASTSGLTDISFDAYSGGHFLTGHEYDSEGLTIVHRDAQPLVILDSAFGFTQFHNLNLNSHPSGVGSNGSTENIDFKVTGGSYAAGLWIGNIGDIDGSNNPNFFDDSNGTLVQFLAADGHVLAQKFLRTDTPGIIQGPLSPNNRIFYGISYSGSLAGADAIYTIRVIEGADDGDGVVFDNVQYGPAAVPEPSTFITWLGLGVAVCLAKAWRNHRSLQRQSGRPVIVSPQFV
ncbi:MAG: hypothetical protein JSS02_29925 [Planctomycetes bacterium]|nr:hypothetical protein [Planctomycetota bacterium]